MSLETADGVSPSTAAAPEKLWCSATRTKALGSPTKFEQAATVNGEQLRPFN
jgi:hypothetical protein